MRYRVSSRLLNCFLYACFVFFVLYSKNDNEITPNWYYWPLIFIYNFNDVRIFGLILTRTSRTCAVILLGWDLLSRICFQLVGFIMKTTIFALFARISDARFGGVYLTLLNSMNNFGRSWPSTVCLWLVDLLTIKSCVSDELEVGLTVTNSPRGGRWFHWPTIIEHCRRTIDNLRLITRIMFPSIFIEINMLLDCWWLLCRSHRM